MLSSLLYSQDDDRILLPTIHTETNEAPPTLIFITCSVDRESIINDESMMNTTVGPEYCIPLLVAESHPYTS